MSAPEHIAPEQLVACPYRCEECGDRLTLDNGVVAFMPGRATIAHEDCAAPMAYHVGFDRLLSLGLEGPNGWREHLSRKRWWTMEFVYVLEMGHKMVRDLESRRQQLDVAPISLMRPVSQSIPRRRPPTPRDPRALRKGTRTQVMERDGFRCRRCGRGPDECPLVIDHVVPVAMGGSGAFDNLQTLCRDCNAGKSDRPPHPHDLGGRA